MTKAKRNYILGLLLVVIAALAAFLCVMSTETTQTASAESATSGLEYTLSDDGTYYSVAGYSGSSTSVVIPSTYNGLPVTEIGKTSFMKSPIDSILIPDSVTIIGQSAFSRCKSLKTVTLPDSVTYIGASAFAYCTSLESLTLGNGVESIEQNAFDNCTSLTKIVIPDSVTTIGSYAFNNCSSATSITIGEGVTKIDYNAFYNLGALTEIYYNAIAADDLSSSSRLFANAGKNSGEVVLKIGKNVTKIPAYLFYDYSATVSTSSTYPKISQIELEDGCKNLESIGDYALYNCKSLKSVTIPENVTYVGAYAFMNCISLMEINYNATAATTEDNYVFTQLPNGCSVTIGANVTEIPSYMFSGGGSGSRNFITSVVFEKNSVCTVINDYAFYYLIYLESINLPDGLTTIGASAFSVCTDLESIIIPESVTSIGDNAFLKCGSLKSVVIPDSVTFIGDAVFWLCTSLDSVTIGCGLNAIGFQMFYYCTSLKSIAIPKNISKIATWAFYNCSALASVTFENTEEWYYTSTEGADSGTDFNSIDLADASTAATYLVTTYYNYYWYCNSSDDIAPTISGASTSETGYYTNGSFTVTAEDEGSGVAYLYYKIPTASTYSSTTSVTKTYSSGVVNGLYCFYAEDNEGNVSETYYVYYDNTAPTLSVSGATFGSATGTSFTVTASDVSGSDTTLYYRKGSSGSFSKASSSSYTVSSTAGDDNYYFYAVDAATNTSSTYVVTLSTTNVNGFFVKSDTDNTVFFYWTNSLWTATLDGHSYSSGTWITEEGTHTVVLTSPTTGSKTYSYTIEHYYEEYQVVEPTCTSQGYTIYRCSQCGETYKGNYTDKAAHTYITTSTVATCTEQGYTTYTCTKCGYSYKADYTEAKGHTYETTVVDPTCTKQGYTIYHCVICGDTYNDDYTDTIPHSYQSVYVAPTCTEGGYIEYTCVNCGDNYTVEISLPTEHSFTITVIRSATCTETGLRHYCCDNCGYEYDVEIPALGHNYVIINVENNDGNTIRTYQCDDCGNTYVEDLGNQAEYVASYVEYLFELYSDYIWWLLFATVGVWSIVMGVFFAIATKNEDKQKARKMVINYLIGLVAIAVILVAAPLLAYGIAVLVT